MNMFELLKVLQQANIRINVGDGKLQIDAPKGAMTKAILTALKQHKEALINYLQSVEVKQTAIVKADRQGKLPLSFAQQRLWFLDQMDGGGSQYNMPGSMRFKGQFDETIVEQAFARIVERHEPLRTIFAKSDDGAEQIILQNIEFKLTILDFSALAPQAQESALLQTAKEEANHVFDLGEDLMFRSTFIRLSKDEGALLFNLHHIATDGWSTGLLVKEFWQQYEAILTGKPNPLAPLSIQYADYAQWQRNWLAGEVQELQLTYWDKQLDDLPQVHTLPLDRARPKEQSFKGARVAVSTSLETLTGLKQLALSCNATLFIVLHGAFSLLLSRHSNSHDIVMGTAVANRLQKELEPIIGFFVNTLVLRADCAGNPTFIDYLGKIKTTNLDAQANQDIPFEHLVERLKPARSTAYSPLFQIMFSMNTNESSVFERSDLTLSPLRAKKSNDSTEELAKFELTLNAIESDAGLTLDFEYNTDLFDASTIKRLGTHLVTLLEGIHANPQSPIADLPMLSNDEQTYLLHTLNDTQVDYSTTECLHQLFEQQVQRVPDGMAVAFEQQQLSYQQLNEKANQLAHHLRAQGVTTETLVGLGIGRSLDMVIAILAILKAGGAYVPLDPNYPQSRIDYMVEDCGITLILGQQVFMAPVDTHSLTTVWLDDTDLQQTLLNYPVSNLPLAKGLSPDNLAYVIYTSGSTGSPKGVLTEHKAVTSFACRNQYIDIDQVSAVLALSPVVFDGSVFDLFVPLTHGKPVVIVAADKVTNTDHWQTLIHQYNVDAAFMTTALFNQFSVDALDVLQHFKQLLFGGEMADLGSVRRFVEQVKDSKLMHVYGPTETTVYATSVQLTSDNAEQLPIGRPLNNKTLYLLDPNRQLTPFGAVGELYIGGAGLARGYLNRPELNSETFIQNPLGHGLLYKTGDLVRYLPGGNVMFVGRVDDQVKIRGFRIELGEVEHQVSQLSEVKACVVMAREDEPGDRRLVAYVSCDNDVEASDLRDNLQAKLPAHMVPSSFVLLNALPLTANGKIDKKALPAPDYSPLTVEYVAPQTDTEITLVQICARLLKTDADSLSITANFFEAGGHSLLSVRLVGEVRTQLAVELAIRDVFDTPQLSQLAALVDQNAGQATRPQVVAVERQSNLLPTSFAQQRLWFIDQMDGASVQYNMPGALRFKGAFDETIVEQAFARIVERHEPLRTVFVDGPEGAQQLIHEQVDFRLTVIDLTELSGKPQAQALQQAVRFDANQPFDLREDLMLRCTFIRLSSNEGALLFNMHHIASDGWSIGVLNKEFWAQYQAIQAGKPDPFGPLSIQYADYAQWQRDWLEGAVLEAQLNYWDDKLAGIPQVHDLPLDRARPAVQGFKGAELIFNSGEKTLKALKKLALEHNATLFMVLHGAFSLLLSRHSGTGEGSNDIVIGVPMANRLQQELEPVIGFFVNTLVLRADCSGNPSFVDFLSQIKSSNLAAQANQDVPFEHLVERLKPARSTAHSPLFQIMFTMNTNESHTNDTAKDDDGGLSLSLLADDSQVVAKFELTLNVVETASGLSMALTYNTELFDGATIERMGNHLLNLLDSIVANPQSDIAELEMLTPTEQDYLLNTLNDTAADYPVDCCIHEMFEQQVQATPDNMAVVFGQEQLTYQSLNEKANRLAHYLRDQGVKPDTLVGLCVERSANMMIAVLAVLKAGGAYLPLDPNYPPQRLDYMVKDSGVSLQLNQKSLTELLTGQVLADYALTNPVRTAHQSPNNLAYVIYTSGSTGQPKGVMLQHTGAVNLALYQQAQFDITAQSRVLQFASFSFDAATSEWLMALLKGAALMICADAQKQSPELLEDYLVEQAITVATLPPALLAHIDVNRDYALSSLVVAGESCDATLAQRWLAKYRLFNAYGPTETTVCATVSQLLADETVNIGRAMHNFQLYVLGEYGQLQPKGSVGELHIAGVGLARGYLNRPDLTAERFIHNPFSDDPQSRLYKTGDLVRYLADGRLEFIGRMDDQVKIRGFRIELGEIEHQLSQLPAVQSAAVLAREGALVAYFTTKPHLADLADLTDIDEQDLVSQLREGLKAALPEYMVPAAFVLLKALPLTVNGKIDRKKLPALTGSALTGVYIAPATETEITLAQIWATLLKIDADTLSATANFFESGGHSLLSVRLVAEVRLQCEVELSIRDIFDTPQLNQLAKVIEQNRGKATRPPVVAIERSLDALPTSFAQQRLWFIDQMDGGSSQYNMPSSMRFKGPLDEDLVEQAFARIVQRHEPLRTVFIAGDSGAQQLIQQDVEFVLTRVDLTGLNAQAQQAAVQQAAREDASQPFDLSADLMLRSRFIRLSADEGVLLFNTHHIASDGWSMGLLVNEFWGQYNALLNQQPNPFEPLAVQYADYAQWQRNWLAGVVLESQLSYWDQQLADLPQVHSLPLDRVRPKVQSFNGGQVEAVTSLETLNGLKQLALDHQVTLFMLLHGAFSLLLSRHSGTGEGSDDIVMGVPMANRLQKELEPVIGFFINTLVLRADCSGNPLLGDYLQQIKTTNLDAQANQDVPFEHLVERLQPDRNTAHSPLFQIMFSMNTNEQPIGQKNLLGLDELDELVLTPLSDDDEPLVAKFEISLTAGETKAGLGLNFEYNSDLFDATTIESMADHLVRLLDGIVANPQSRIGDLPILSDAEQHYQLHTLNQTKVDYADELLVHQLFEQQVQNQPQSIGAVFEQTELSYLELNQKANRLACYLRDQGVTPDSLVGLCVNRSLDMLVGILAILKAGGGYVPLDPDYPQSRLDHMVKDSGITLLLSQQDISTRIQSDTLTTVWLDEHDFSAYSADNLPTLESLTPANLAYVIYTSGSTGLPKGVGVEHRHLTSRLAYIDKLLALGEGDSVPAIASFAFDISLAELVYPLSCGAQVLMLPLSTIKEVSLLAQQLSGCRFIHMVPSLAQVWLDQINPADYQQLKYLATGGDAVPPSLVTALGKTLEHTTILQFYGPTEATLFSACHPDAASQPSSLGKAIDNATLYILDNNDQLVPYGAVGQLHIGGAGVTRGYLNREALNAQQFITSPFGHGGDGGDNGGERIYRTGDLVRYLADGNLAFMGRIDSQVKIRGFRIELGEIEHQLAECAGVASALVLARDEQGEKRLVAYLVAEAEQTIAFAPIKAQLLAKMPEYMAPSAFVLLDEWPLTANGKIDRKALPAADSMALQGEYIAPVTTTEIALAQIWSLLLKTAADKLGKTANFFESGGHSLLSVRLVAEIRAQLGVEVTIRDIFDAPQLAQLAQRIDQNAGKATRPQVEVIERNSNHLPVSFAQQRLWFIDQMDGGSSQYNMPGAMRFSGLFDQNIVEQAFIRIIRRHEPLRTVFVNGEQGAQQVILDDFEFTLNVIDLTGLNDKAQEEAVQQAARADAGKDFDLSADLMLRSSLIQLSANDGVLLFNMHHIASDGWSMGLLINEFWSQYKAIMTQQPDPFEPLAIQYADYAQWQRNWLAGEVLESQLAYWQQQLADLPPVHSLPLDRVRPKQRSVNGERVMYHTDEQTLAGLKQLALDHHVTLFMLLHGAFSLLLSRHSNETDIVMGVPVANRLQKELEPVIGFFVNTLVLRADCSGNPTLSDFITQIKTTNLDAQANQDVPFEHLVDRLKPSRSTAHTPLFQILFSMNIEERSASQADTLELGDLTLSSLKNDTVEVVSKFELTLNAIETPNGLTFAFTYNRDIFNQDTIDGLGAHMVSLLQGMVANPHSRIADLPLLNQHEQDYLLNTLNETQIDAKADSPKAQCIHQLFEQQVALTPDAIALVFEQQQLSYQTLNQKANRLAHYLRDQGVKADTLVGLCVARSLDMVVAILAILKAGGAYVPLDPDYPQSRLNHMIKDSGIELLLGHKALSQKAVKTADNAESLKTLWLDDKHFEQVLADYNSGDLSEQVSTSAEHLAYVIYTSGSTGLPKGVMVEHGNLMAFNVSYKKQLQILSQSHTPINDGAWLWTASFAFDASMKSLLSMAEGQQVVIVSAMNSKDPAALAALIRRYKVGVYNAPPALMAAVIDSMEQAKEPADGIWPGLIVSGDQVADDVLAKIQRYCQAHQRQAINAYGPTETTVNSTSGLLGLAGQPLNIGRPIANTQVYVLDAHQKPVPLGVVGELYIGGAGVARGYLNLPELTDECFIDNPFVAGERLYKTGDLVRYLGAEQHQLNPLAFVGRVDDQVKIRGFRMELGEIQYQLSQLPQVESAVVLAREDELVAYVTAADTVGDKEDVLLEVLRAGLQAVLPDYMIPAFFVVLAELPLNANGKVDKKALPAPQGVMLSAQYVAPANSSEAKQVEIWAQQLQLEVEQVSVTANFFELGGNSILLLKLVAALVAAGIPRTIKQFYEHQTIRAMSEAIAQQTGDSAVELESVVKLNQATCGPNFYAFHPVDGRVNCYDRLAAQLQDSCRLYGIQAPFNYGKDLPFDTINELAEFYKTAIKLHQPEGPYHMIGWSAGGLLAQRVAWLLSEQGDEVEYLVLVDSFLLNHDQSEPLERYEHLQNAFEFALAEKNEHSEGESVLDRLGSDFKQKTYTEQLDIVADQLIAAQRNDYASKQELVLALKFFVNYIKTDRPLTPTKLSGKGLLLKASDDKKGPEALLKAWHDTVLSESRVVKVTGQHAKMMQDQCLDEIVTVLRGDLQEMQP